MDAEAIFADRISRSSEIDACVPKILVEVNELTMLTESPIVNQSEILAPTNEKFWPLIMFPEFINKILSVIVIARRLSNPAEVISAFEPGSVIAFSLNFTIAFLRS